MKRVAGPIVAICFLSNILLAQYGTAPSGYYPDGYHGSIFKGVVTETKDNQIILTYTKGSSTETFTGVFETGCSVPTAQPGGPLMTASDIPKGTAMTAFFTSTTKTVDGNKIKENPIIAIAFDTWRGQKVAEDKKKMYWCTKSGQLVFRAY